MIRTGLGLLLVVIPTLTYAATDWRCSNLDVEIICTSGKCSPSASFTPMDIGISEAGSMSICAYSGCWEGKGEVFSSGDHILLSGHRLRWVGADPGRGEFMIALDKSTGVAVINGEAFAMPLICSPGGKVKVPKKFRKVQ